MKLNYNILHWLIVFIMIYLNSFSATANVGNIEKTQTISLVELKNALGSDLIHEKEWERINKYKLINVKGWVFKNYIIFNSVCNNNCDETFAYDTIRKELTLISDFKTYLKDIYSIDEICYDGKLCGLVGYQTGYYARPVFYKDLVICYFQIAHRTAIDRTVFMIYRHDNLGFHHLNSFYYDSLSIDDFEILSEELHLFGFKQTYRFRWEYLIDFITRSCPGPWERVYLSKRLDYKFSDSLNIFEFYK